MMRIGQESENHTVSNYFVPHTLLKLPVSSCLLLAHEALPFSVYCLGMSRKRPNPKVSDRKD